jgi:hypothetical protein
MSEPNFGKVTKAEVIQSLASAICGMRDEGASRERIIRVVEGKIEELNGRMSREPAIARHLPR